jgi:serine/threonine protein kinase
LEEGTPPRSTLLKTCTLERSTNKHLALKKIHQNSQDSVRELEILKSLNHPNLIRIVDDFMENDKLCIVLEKAECILIS